MVFLIKIFGKNARERGAGSVSMQEIALETDFFDKFEQDDWKFT